MSFERRHWLWIAIVVAAVGVTWWLTAPSTTTSPAPREAPALAASPEPPPSSEPSARPELPPGDADTPSAAPLPRDEVELPGTHRTPDAGVGAEDPASLEQKRDQMLTTVLDRLKEELDAAEQAGNGERAASLRIRIERLEQRRNELAGQ